MRKPLERLDHYFSKRPKSEIKTGIVRAYLRGKIFEFITASGVFSKKRIDLGTKLLIESMILPEDGYVLDIGCGYGAVGICAAAFNSKLHVFMVDVNERALRLARRNAEMNNVENVTVKRGHLYKPVNELAFNCILSNPPVSAGMKVVEEIILDAPRHMVDNATFQMVVKSKIGGKRLFNIFEKAFGNIEILARESGYRVLISTKK